MGGARDERCDGWGGRVPIISPDVPHGGRNDRRTIREGRRELKDGGDERKSKEENQENKIYIRDFTEEEERDEELKSIYLLFFCCFFFCFPRVRFMSYSPKVVFFFLL